MGWIQEEVEVLIEEYRKRAILYHVKDPLYHNRTKKEIAWQQIKEIMQKMKPKCTVDQLKSKINGLRSHFSNELSKVKDSQRSGSGTSDVYVPSVWWFQKLQFLTPHVEARTSTSSMQTVVEDDKDTSEEVFALFSFFNPIECTIR